MPAVQTIAAERPKPIAVRWLSLASNLTDHGHEEFIRLGANVGCEIDFIRLPPPISDAQFTRLLDAADAFIVTMEDVVGHPAFREAVISAVHGGKRLLVIGPRRDLNPLLHEFDLAVTENRLYDTSTITDDVRTLIIRSEENSTHPVASALFAHSAITTIGSPAQVWYGSAAVPILKAGAMARMLNPGDFDEDPGPRLLCCGGIWPLESKNGEGVLLIAGNALRNPYHGPTGKFFTGIRANIAFAESVVTWLRGELKTSVRVGLAIEMLHSIEVGLYDIVVAVLKRHYNGSADAWWYEGVPLEMRTKAAELSEESKGKIPKEEGFYFIAYRKIIESNWPIFAAHFEADKQGKKSLTWIQSLNDLRNRLSHPLRVRSEPITAAETAELRTRHEWISRLSHSLTGSTA
jgi:hypothetical protein